jgi:hypothetical protein
LTRRIDKQEAMALEQFVIAGAAAKKSRRAYITPAPLRSKGADQIY